jgi:hypothetical protein
MKILAILFFFAVNPADFYKTIQGIYQIDLANNVVPAPEDSAGDITVDSDGAQLCFPYCENGACFPGCFTWNNSADVTLDHSIYSINRHYQWEEAGGKISLRTPKASFVIHRTPGT